MGRSKRKRNNYYDELAKERKKQRDDKRKKEKEFKKEKLKNKNVEKKYLIGLYGDYRKDAKDHHFITKKENSSRYIGTFYTEPIYDLYEVENNEPALVKGNTSVLMEVYEISESLLNNLDVYHGFETLENKDNYWYYNRKQIESPFGEIFTYFWDEKIKNDNIFIESGDWVDAKNTRTLKHKSVTNN